MTATKLLKSATRALNAGNTERAQRLLSRAAGLLGCPELIWASTMDVFTLRQAWHALEAKSFGGVRS